MTNVVNIVLTQFFNIDQNIVNDLLSVVGKNIHYSESKGFIGGRGDIKINYGEKIILNNEEYDLACIYLKEVLNIIVFEMVYKDLGYTEESIISHIKNKGGSELGINKVELIKEFIEEDLAIKAKEFKLENSPYFIDGNYLSYFRDKVPNLKKAIDITFNKVCAYILTELYRQKVLLKNSYFIGVDYNDISLSFLVPKSYKKFLLDTKIYVRVKTSFGLIEDNLLIVM